MQPDREGAEERALHTQGRIFVAGGIFVLRMSAEHGDHGPIAPDLFQVAGDHGEQPAGRVDQRLRLDANTQVGRCSKAANLGATQAAERRVRWAGGGAGASA